MAKFPVEISDTEGIVDAVNNLLSGPSGLGQNFAGFSSYAPAYLTGNYRTPFTQPNTVGIRNLYVAPIALATSEFVDDRTLKFTFASTQPSAPFQPGNQVTISGVTIPAGVYDYNGTYTRIGILSCTTTYCLVRLSAPETVTASASGGNISLISTDKAFSTDCNARVTVTGGTDRVFISGQLDQTINYNIISGNHDLTIKVQVNRYIGSLNSDPVNPDYLFDPDGTVAEKVYLFTNLHGTGSVSVETIFSTLLDEPGPNYYWYILEVTYIGSSSDVEVTSVDFGLRSLSTQVVKQ